MKKITSIIITLILVLGNSATAMEFFIKNNDEGIIIEGKADNKKDKVSVTVYDRNNNLVYIDQTRSDSDGNFQFKAGVGDQTGLKIKVGGEDYSPVLQYSDGVKNYDVYYIDEYSNNNQQTKENTYSTISEAYSYAKDGDEFVILGNAQWDSSLTGDKKVKFTNGTLIFNSGEINIPAEFDNITLSFDGVNDVECWDIKFGENVKIDGDISLYAENVQIYGGTFKNITAEQVQIFKKSEFESITNSTAVVINDDVDFDENKISSCDYVITTTSGGNVQTENGEVLLIPQDERVVSVNGGEYLKYAKISQPGKYNVRYDYDFKLHEIRIEKNINGYAASVDISMYNRNNSYDNPLLIAGIYDEQNKLMSVCNKTLEAGSEGCVDIPLGKIDKKGFLVKFYVWDSFKNMCPLCDVITANEEDEQNTCVYVWENGSDENAGTITSPFKTIHSALNSIKNSTVPVTVYLREGKYVLDKEIVFDSEFSNIEIKPYNDEEVSLTTAYEIKGTEFTKADDEISALVIDDTARENLLCVSLDDFGIYASGEYSDYTTSTNETVIPVISQDDKRMELCRYPDFGYLSVGNNITAGDGTNIFGFDILNGIERAGLWHSTDIYADGYIKYHWLDARIGVNISQSGESYIFRAKDSTLKMDSESGNKVRFVNIPEEITMPGEWYIDKNAGKLYIYPYEGFNDNTVITYNPYITDINDLIKIDNTSLITFEDITFEHIGTDVLDISQSDSISIKNCRFYDIIGEPVTAKKSTEILISDNIMNNLSGGGISVEGGNSEKLIKANNIVTNNEIYDFSNDRRTYTPAISFSGCGNTVSHNKIYDAGHMAVGMGGIEFVFEYNDISDVCKETADSGAMYAGQYIHLVNNVIRYNYFHNIKNIIGVGYTVNAVYFDELWSSCDVYSNVFYDVQQAGLIGGGRSNKFRNNLFIECDRSVMIDSRGTSLESIEDHRAYINLYYSPYRSEIWKKEFPLVYNILEDDPLLPKYNVISGNIFIDTPMPILSGVAQSLTECKNNLSYEKLDVLDCFYDYENQNFGLLKDSIIYSQNPDFEEIKFNEIGIVKE